MSKTPPPARRCAYFWERRSKGKRYVNARGQCKGTARVGKSYCSAHRGME